MHVMAYGLENYVNSCRARRHLGRPEGAGPFKVREAARELEELRQDPQHAQEPLLRRAEGDHRAARQGALPEAPDRLAFCSVLSGTSAPSVVFLELGFYVLEQYRDATRK